MKSIKRYLSIILVLCMLLCCTSMLTVSAAKMAPTDNIVTKSQENLIGENELQPMTASRCYDGDDVIYVNYSIAPNDFVSPNSTIYYTSTGTPSGVVYSIIFTNSFGGTWMRHDLVSYNGTVLHHKYVTGPHTHIYTWWVHEGQNRYTEKSVVPYGG